MRDHGRCEFDCEHVGRGSEVIFGEAATYCYEDKEGYLWVGNGEYGNVVNFCPFCGTKARTPAEGKLEKA